MGYSSLSELRPLRLDTVAAVGGLLIALALLPLQLLVSQIYLRTVPIVLGLACGLYLVSLYQRTDADALPALPSSVALSLPALVLVGLSSMVALPVLQGERTIHFFGLSALVGTLVLIQIVFTADRDFNRGVVLMQIVLFALVFRLTALYVTPGYIGIDIWTHMEFVEQIRNAEMLGAISHDKHYGSPFYHLLVLASSFIYDVPLRGALYLSVGIVMPLAILLIYATANLLVSARWATLATALFAFANYVSMWGMQLIPTSLGLLFFLGLLYALIRVMRVEYTGRDFSLLILFSIAIILTHQVSTFIMLVLLLAAFVAQIIFVIGPLGLTRLDTSVFRAKKPVNLFGLVVFNFGLTIFIWSLTPYGENSFLATVLLFFTETLEESAGFLNITSGSTGDGAESSAQAATTLLEQAVPYLDNLGFLVLLCLTFAGCLYVVHRRRAEQSVFTLLLAAAIMLTFILVLPMFGIRNFIPTRWFAFLYAPMAILGAIGLRSLNRNLSLRIVVSILLVFTLIYPGAMIVAVESNAENPIFSDQHERLAYDQTELAAVESIGEMTGSPDGDEIRPDQQLYTDHPYMTVFSRTGAYPSTGPVSIPENESIQHDYTVYREEQSTDATFFVDENGREKMASPSKEQICRPEQAVVYTNGDVSLCTASPATNSA